MKKIELLAPAGNIEILKIAVQAGANAVYLAGKNFGARAYSQNFTNNELIEAVEYAHLRNVKLYVTVNTIIYNDEWEELEKYIDFLYKIKIDALIVQDLGVLRFLRKNYPDFEVHASTQMNVYDKKGALFLLKNGVKRVVLARETTIQDAIEISKTGIEVEIFGHGALCFCASGNCLMSYAIGKRSGNRGQCAQPCRKRYSLMEDGLIINSNAALLSMKDLKTIDYLPQIIDGGITSLKIEGRMKSREYVYTVIKSYRDAIDYYYNYHRLIDLKSINDELLVAFNRQFTKGYLFSEKNDFLTNIKNVNHQGLEIGKVINCTKNYVEIKLSKSLNVRDAIRIIGKNEFGFVVEKMFVNGNEVKNSKSTDIVKIPIKEKVFIGDRVVKTKNSMIDIDISKLMKNENIKIEVTVKLKLHYLEKPKLELYIDNNSVVIYGDTLKEIANKPLSEDYLVTRINKTTDTVFLFKEIIIDYDKKAYISVKDLNELRRNAISKLNNIILENYNRTLKNYIEKYQKPVTTKCSIEAIVNNSSQYNVCKEKGIEIVYTDYPSDNINKIRLNNKKSCNGLIQNIGDIDEDGAISPYLNVSNLETIKFLISFGINKIYLSNELIIDNIKEFSLVANDIDLGVMVYGKMDLMVTKHCFISKSYNLHNKNCGLCKNHNYSLLDEYNNKMDIITNQDVDCSIRILDYKTRNWIQYISMLREFNIRKFLLVFTTESKEQVEKIINECKKSLFS